VAILVKSMVAEALTTALRALTADGPVEVVDVQPS